jgi:hypothetical protein
MADRYDWDRDRNRIRGDWDRNRESAERDLDRERRGWRGNEDRWYGTGERDDFSSRGDWGGQGHWGSYANRADFTRDNEWRFRAGDRGIDPGWGRNQDWGRNERNERYSGGTQTYAGGMGSFSGGLGSYSDRGRFAGRGPKGWQRPDERIREDINERLTEHPEIDASEIEVQVRAGEVTLTGTVDDRHAKRMAEDLAERVSGVKDVHNNIRVQTSSVQAQEEEQIR